MLIAAFVDGCAKAGTNDNIRIVDRTTEIRRTSFGKNVQTIKFYRKDI